MEFIARLYILRPQHQVFDPIRVWMVEGKILHWFDIREYSLFRWLKENTPSLSSWNHETLKLSNVAEVWKDRTVAQETVKKYLAEYPCEPASFQPCNSIGPSCSLHYHIYLRSTG